MAHAAQGHHRRHAGREEDGGGHTWGHTHLTDVKTRQTLPRIEDVEDPTVRSHLRVWERALIARLNRMRCAEHVIKIFHGATPHQARLIQASDRAVVLKAYEREHSDLETSIRSYIHCFKKYLTCVQTLSSIIEERIAFMEQCNELTDMTTYLPDVDAAIVQTTAQMVVFVNQHKDSTLRAAKRALEEGARAAEAYTRIFGLNGDDSDEEGDAASTTHSHHSHGDYDYESDGGNDASDHDGGVADVLPPFMGGTGGDEYNYRRRRLRPAEEEAAEYEALGPLHAVAHRAAGRRKSSSSSSPPEKRSAARQTMRRAVHPPTEPQPAVRECGFPYLEHVQEEEEGDGDRTSSRRSRGTSSYASSSSNSRRGRGKRSSRRRHHSSRRRRRRHSSSSESSSDSESSSQYSYADEEEEGEGGATATTPGAPASRTPSSHRGGTPRSAKTSPASSDTKGAEEEEEEAREDGPADHTTEGAAQHASILPEQQTLPPMDLFGSWDDASAQSHTVSSMLTGSEVQLEDGVVHEEATAPATASQLTPKSASSEEKEEEAA